MSTLKKIYRNNINGIIFTLIFHILLFLFLLISEFDVKKKFVETELLIDFPEEIVEAEIKQEQEQIDKKNTEYTSNPTNVASNKSAPENDDFFDEDYMRELNEARNLSKDVSSQLSKKIPTIKDLEMPEKVNKETDSDSIFNKQYTGDSNIEYFLENRYHIKLPVPVYLAHGGGTVLTSIIVNRKGEVIKAEPENSGNLPEMLLSYAKTAALRTKFNADSDAPFRQKGTITYHFIPQK